MTIGEISREKKVQNGNTLFTTWDGKMKHNFLALALLTFAAASHGVRAEEARFETSPVNALWVTRTEDPNGRKMKLAADFTYVDSKGQRWLAPKGAIVDGASIPRAFWSILGGPYEGTYREASVIHDVACVQRKLPWKEVHRMFYEAMLTSGVELTKAKLMYAAVYHFGPRWNTAKSIDQYSMLTARATLSTEELLVQKNRLGARIGAENVRSWGREKPDANPGQDEIAFYNKLAAEIQTKDLSVDQIEKFR